MTFIDDPISANVNRYFTQIADNVVRNMATGNWERATRWAELLWAITDAAQPVVWKAESSDA